MPEKTPKTLGSSPSQKIHKHHSTSSKSRLVGGFNPSEKYEFVSWDDDIPNIWKHQSHVPNHQSVKDRFPS